jgi:hypothetical protein
MDDDPKPGRPVEHHTVPTLQFLMSPLPDLVGDDVSPEERAAPADVAPKIDTQSWPMVVTRLGGMTFRQPPSLPVRSPPNALFARYEGRQILVDSWQGNDFHLALWLGPEGDYPTHGYPLSFFPRLHDWTQTIAKVNQREIHLASFRITSRAQPIKYHVAAYWLHEPDIWASVSGSAPNRTGQEQFLAMLRSLGSARSGSEGTP